MSSLQQQMKAYQNSINDLKEEIDRKKKDLTKLKNDNTLRIEKLDWTKEKTKKMEREIKNMKQQDQTLSVRNTVLSTKQQQEKIVQLEKQNKEQDKGENEQPPDIDQMQMLEYFNTYLDNTNKQQDKYSSFKRKEDVNDYINPYPTINVKHTLEGIGISQSSSFRLDNNTDFRMLKELAFYFWNLDAYLVNDDVNEKEALETLELTDENHAHIEMKEKVIEFYQSRGMQNFSQTTILLQRKKASKDSLNNLQIEHVKITGGNKNALFNLQSFVVKKARIQKVETYKTFFQKFPGLKYYISEIGILKESEEKETTKTQDQDAEFELDDMNCLVISILAVILAVTLVSYSSYLSSASTFQSFKFLKNLLDIRDNEQYEQIRGIPAIYDYMEQKIGRTIFNSDSEDNPVRVNFEIIGSVQLRILRTSVFNCTEYVNEIQKQSCFDPHYENNGSILFNNLLDHSEFNEWKYNTPEELGIHYFQSGNITTFTEGGYVEEFNRDITVEQYKERINYLKLNNFLDETTAVIFINFLLYSPSMNSWIAGNYLLERGAYNMIQPYPAQLIAFIPNIYYGTEGEQLFRNDLVRLIFACLLLAFITFRVYRISKVNWRGAVSYLFLEVGLFNMGVGVFSMLSVITAIKQSSKGRDLQQLVNEETYVNLAEEAELYKQAEIFTTLTIMFIFLRLSYILKLNDRIAIIFLTYYKGFRELFAFLAIQFPLFLGFAFVFQILFGDTLSQYSSFIHSVASQLSLIQGQFSLEEFTLKTPVLSLIVILVYYFFMLFFIISLFQAILIECYRSVIMKMGYPQDKEASWTMKDLFMWFFSWTALFKSKKEEEDPQSKPLLKEEHKDLHLQSEVR